MEREKLIDIWSVFRICKFEVNYGDIICIIFIFPVGMLENCKLQLGYRLG
jgi:hypothetical protein